VAKRISGGIPVLFHHLGQCSGRIHAAIGVLIARRCVLGHPDQLVDDGFRQFGPDTKLPGQLPAGVDFCSGKLLQALGGFDRDGVPRSEQPIEEETKVGAISKRPIHSGGVEERAKVGGNVTRPVPTRGEEVTEDAATRPLVTGGVAGRIVFGEGLVEEAELAPMVDQQAGVPQQVLQEGVPVLRADLFEAVDGFVRGQCRGS
jgi:hypothetical protein